MLNADPFIKLEKLSGDVVKATSSQSQHSSAGLDGTVLGEKE